MATYEDWNRALASYFISGISRSTKIYLSVDDDILERIGQDFGLTLTADNWGDDFCVAVRKQVINDGQVNLAPIQKHDSDGLPKSVAFLGATVLAAYQMADEEKISELNYFRRLRELLGLSGSGRPAGMKSGKTAEEPLWENWNLWLMQHRFLPSAHQGRGGSTTYINYPISQSLLRRADKERLQRLFDDQQWTAQWDAMILFAHVRLQAQGLSRHLQELLTDNRQRYEAVAEAIHEVYLQWQDDGKPGALKVGVRTFVRHIFAGLYRTEDPFKGTVDYYLYPKQVRGRKLESVQVQYKDSVYQLSDERPGWYFPLDCAISATELARGARYQITCPADLDFLILPARDFWILIPDPDNPDAGAYASWGQPSLGSQFILLCKKELLPDLDRLRDEHLLQWNGEPQPVFNHSSWVELHQCMVISQAWDGIFINNQGLKDALQPSVRLSISFSGGLRVPQLGAWLVGYSPQVTVFSFSPKVQLKITRLSNNFQILDRAVDTNTTISLDFPSQDDYLVEATFGSELSQCFVKIIDWSLLPIEQPSGYEELPICSGHHICGSLIKSVLIAIPS
ncbi:MAG TPA: hypothetical protein V6D15_18355 [Oculatellaceae cyanobacterium]|jgi:hypothetical protein